MAAANLSAQAEQAAAARYRIQSGDAAWRQIAPTLSGPQVGLLEKLNRADRPHLPRLPVLVIPHIWDADELAYSVMPRAYAAGARYPKLVVVHLPGQVFGAYEFGNLVRWGPVSSGRRARMTPAGLFALNWKSPGHASSVNPEWYLPWYFNFERVEGLALHAYVMPGRPASHGCLRLLERDAVWLFDWGDEWTLDAHGTRLLHSGTPVLIVGAYDFDAPPPWRSQEWLAQEMELPPLPLPGTSTP